MRDVILGLAFGLPGGVLLTACGLAWLLFG
jgi:hypothetical protein